MPQRQQQSHGDSGESDSVAVAALPTRNRLPD
jgi:hypothetical protein